MSSVTAVITNYMRLANVERLIDVLRQQTVAPTIFVWDNSPNADFDDARIAWLIRSSKNARCAARWWMAAHAETDFVLIHDDDLIPSHNKVLAQTIEAATKVAPFAVGAAGVILKRNRRYFECRHVGVRAKRIGRDKRVDIVKGFYFCCPTERLTRISYMDLDAEDDIAVSARLGKGREHPHLVLSQLRKSFEFLPEGKTSRKHRSNHREARELARRRFFDG